MQISELRNLNVGDTVRWNDPDDAIASGVYSIQNIATETGRIEDWDSILYIVSNNTGTQAEVMASEIC